MFSCSVFGNLISSLTIALLFIFTVHVDAKSYLIKTAGNPYLVETIDSTIDNSSCNKKHYTTDIGPNRECNTKQDCTGLFPKCAGDKCDCLEYGACMLQDNIRKPSKIQKNLHLHFNPSYLILNPVEKQNGWCLTDDELEHNMNVIYFLGNFSKKDCLEKCSLKSLAMACEWSLYQTCAYHTEQIVKGSGDKDAFCWILKPDYEIKKYKSSTKQDQHFNNDSRLYFRGQAKFTPSINAEKWEQVYDSESGLFCEEISIDRFTGDYDDAKGSLFIYANYTDVDGFPIYFNKNDGQYMVRPFSDNQDFGDYDASKEVSTGNINEYRIVETSRIFDFDSKYGLLQMIPPMSKTENGIKGYSTYNFIRRRCLKMSKQAKPASSVYAKWPIPSGSLDSATSWELGCTLKPLSSYLHTYFMTVGWAPGGYGGFQQTPDIKKAPSGKLALFSFWNDGNHNVHVKDVNINDSVIVERFRGEGTGQKASIDFNWNPGEKMSMKVKGTRTDKDSNKWEVSAYIKYEGDGYHDIQEFLDKLGDDAGYESMKKIFAKNSKAVSSMLPKVSCGNHKAESCSKCGKVPEMCNGVCKWKSGSCKMKAMRHGDYAELSAEWTHMATFSRTGKHPLNRGGFSVFIEDWQRRAGEEGYLHKRSAEFRDPYLVVNGKRMRLKKPIFNVVKEGFDAFAAKYTILKEIGPPGSGNVYMSTGIPSSVSKRADIQELNTLLETNRQ